MFELMQHDLREFILGVPGNFDQDCSCDVSQDDGNPNAWHMILQYTNEARYCLLNIHSLKQIGFSNHVNYPWCLEFGKACMYNTYMYQYVCILYFLWRQETELILTGTQIQKPQGYVL